MAESAPESVAAPRGQPPGGGFWRHGLRLALLPLAGLLLAVALALAALWVWAGAEGSLATALHWAGHWTALTAQGVHGSVRHGGTVEQLAWTAPDGLRVQASGARIAWSPAALLHRQLHIRQLAAAQIVIEEPAAAAPEPPEAGPPQSLALPLALRVDAVEAGQVRWTGLLPIPVTVLGLAGSYQYADGKQHALEIRQARIETQNGSADLRGRATLQAQSPLALDAALSGTLQSQATPPLTVQATLRGPLADMQATLDAQAAASAGAAAQQEAQVRARLTPWAAQPLPQASAQVARLDLRTLLAAFWPQAPRTAITGQLEVAPTGADGWRAGADLTDAGRSLPIDRAQADVDWQGRTLTVRTLTVSGAGSRLQASGRWQLDARQGVIDAALNAPGAALTVKGEVAPERGAGQARADVADAARLLAWARALPGLNAALAGLPAMQGQAHFSADWRGGWRNAQTAAVQAELRVPELRAQVAADTPIHIQDLHASLNGTLAQAHLALDGRASQGERQGALHLRASGGQASGQVWRVSVSSLTAQAHDPQWGAWTLASAAPVALAYAAKPGGAFEAGAGAVTLGQDAASGEHITLAWDASRWDGRALTTSGRLNGLSLAWLERLTGENRSGYLGAAEISDDVMLAGAWRAHAGPGLPLDVHASLERTAGDLTLTASDPQTGLQTQVAAGLRVARVALQGSGREVLARVQWDSERAGQINAELRTQLAATPGGMGWAWPEDAPLTGQISAHLPQMAVWSTLAPPGWRLRGTLTADAHIAGTRGDPHITGTLAADRLALRSVVDGVQLNRGQLRAHFDGTQLVIDALSLYGAGRNGSGGTLTATGHAGWVDGHAQAQLTVTLDRLRASIRADRQLTLSGQAQAELDGRKVTASGQLKVDQASITLPKESAPALDDDVVVHAAHDRTLRGQVTETAQRQRPAPDPEEALQADVQVQIDLGEKFHVQGQGVDTRLKGVLTLAAQGPLTALPRLTGTINTEGGRFRAYGQNLEITRGALRFTGAADNPTLDILALRPIYDSNQKAGVQVQGTALLPRVRLYSDPALPDSQTLAWLLLGRAAPANGAESAMLQAAALALLGGREGTGLAGHLGLDELSLNNTTDASGAQSASVMLGKRLSKRLYAAYQQSLSGATGSLMIFYELSRRWQLRAQTGQNAGVDLIFSLMF